MGTRLVLIKGELGFEAFEIHPIEPKQKTTIACEI